MRDFQIEQFEGEAQTRDRLAVAEALAETAQTTLVNAAAAVNGAGLIALGSYLASRNLERDLAVAACVAAVIFLVGLVSAGWTMFSDLHARRLTVYAYRHRVTGFQLDQHFRPHMDPAELKPIDNARSDNGTRLSNNEMEAIQGVGKALGRAFLWFGLGFAVALGTVAVDVLRASKPDADAIARCAALQGDMLSARPRRPDGPELFQALGCRPRGEGSVYAPPQRDRAPRKDQQ